MATICQVAAFNVCFPGCNVLYSAFRVVSSNQAGTMVLLAGEVAGGGLTKNGKLIICPICKPSFAFKVETVPRNGNHVLFRTASCFTISAGLLSSSLSF